MDGADPKEKDLDSEISWSDGDEKLPVGAQIMPT